MCGIAGIFNRTGAAAASFDTLEKMIAMVQHRGPDGHGFYRDAYVGLAHSRLSIIDLHGGFQPLSACDEQLWISFNGEIFNYLELREELSKKGFQFKTHTDTETILACYQVYGTEAWKMLNGQFAFALWDKRKGKLHLVRDRLGILPLHYHVSTDQRILFGSEIKSLFASGLVDPDYDIQGLAQVFSQWAAQSPTTIFAGIQSVRPGHALSIDTDFNMEEVPYWQPNFKKSDELAKLSDEDIADALEEKLKAAVNLRLRADVPVGAYLSGGLDSSVISQMIKQLHSGELETYAIRFADQRFDETPQQRLMAKHLGTHHHEVICDDRDISEGLPEVIWHCETPLTRTSPIPLYMLSRLVRGSSMKVVMTGEGADEFLGGYNIFKESKIRRYWAKQPESQIRPLLLKKIYPYIGRGGTNVLWQDFFKRGYTNLDDPIYSHRIRWENTAWMWRFLSEDIRHDLNLKQQFTDFSEKRRERMSGISTQSQAQLLEVDSFMSAYLLPFQGDRVAMANSIEVRYPFLDPDVVDFCTQLPDNKILSSLKDKRPLRKLASKTLPQEIWARPKQPYRAPITPPLFGANRPEYVDDLLSIEALEKSGIWNGKAAMTLVNKAKKREGHMGGEREEMALIGMVTLQLLDHEFFKNFAVRSHAALQSLKKQKCAVKVDKLP